MSLSGLRSRQIAALALGMGVFFTAQVVLMALAGRGGVDLEWDVAQELLYWGVWAALAPLVRATLMRWPVPLRGAGRSVLIHAFIAPVLAALQTTVAFGLHLFVLWFVGTVTVSEFPLWIARLRPSLIWGTFMGTFFHVLVVGVDAAIRLRRLYTGAQLDALRSQLRPHFLFNTLNAISVLIVEEPARARQMLLRLGTLLRRTFEESAREIPLQQEIASLNDYLDIQRVRFGSRLTVTVSVDDSVAAALVPPFLLQPLVENAMEHAVALREQPTVVTLRAARTGDALHISIEDNGPGPSAAAHLREGVGLRNTRETLSQLYGAASSVTLRGTDGPMHAGARTEVVLPFILTRS